MALDPNYISKFLTNQYPSLVSGNHMLYSNTPAYINQYTAPTMTAASDPIIYPPGVDGSGGPLDPNWGSTGGGGGANVPPQGNYSAPDWFNTYFNLPSFGGPYGAPLVPGQLDAMNAFRNLFLNQPLFQTQGLLDSLNAALGTGDPNAPLPQTPRYDNTEYFQNAEQAFQTDLGQILANTRERLSSGGARSGGSDRDRIIAGTAGDALSRFRLGLQDVERQSFENAENRRLQAIPLAMQQQLTPYNLATQMYQMNEMARQAADQNILRQMQEYGRTQGGLANIINAVISGTPLENTLVGPSQGSQWTEFFATTIPLVIKWLSS